VSPNVGAVVCDKYGQIADNPDAVIVGVPSYLVPLPMKQELRELVIPNLVFQVVFGRRERRGIP
jgi:hypothetical protein